MLLSAVCSGRSMTLSPAKMAVAGLIPGVVVQDEASGVREESRGCSLADWVGASKGRADRVNAEQGKRQTRGVCGATIDKLGMCGEPRAKRIDETE